MHAGHDDKGHHGSKQRHAHKAKGVVQPQHKGAEVGAKERANGAQYAVSQRDHDHNGDQRLQHRAQNGRGVLGNKLLNGCHHGAAQDNGENGAGIAHTVHRDAQEIECRAGGHAAGKGGVDQQTADDHAQCHIGPKLLGCKGADHDGQEIEACITGKGQQLIGAIVGRDTCHIQQDQDDLDHAAADQGRDQRRKRAGNAVKDLIHDSLYALLLRGCVGIVCFHCFFRSKTVLLADQLVHRADVLPNDDLQLFAGPLCSGNTRQILDLVHLNDAAVLHIEAQPCDAVGKEPHIVLAADQLNNAVGQHIIIFCHGCSPPCFCKQFLWVFFYHKPVRGALPGGSVSIKNPSAPQNTHTAPAGHIGAFSAALWGKALQRRSAFIGHNPHEHTND